MERLLSAGADPELRDNQGRTTLHKLITVWPYWQNWPRAQSKFQAVMSSSQRRAEACLCMLCEKGVNVNAEVEDKGRQTALHLAVQHAAVTAVEILASYGADVNAVDCNGEMPLHMASGTLQKDIIASLVRQGADVNRVLRDSGNSPLHRAAFAATIKGDKTLEADLSCISELLAHGAELNAVNRSGKTPLQDASSLGKEEVVDLLLSYGADVNRRTEAGENCLFLFLNHAPNLRHGNGTLLAKLLGLTSPLTIYNRDGLLPAPLTLPEFSEQRRQLLELTLQPRTLRDICKIHIYLRHNRTGREELKNSLPQRLYDFIFHYWESPHNISFMAEGETNSSK
ncbi:ankyrin repeat domain-containing protein 61-like [Polymixia lowei]